MIEIKYCPSTLAEGYNTYSPQAVRRLFEGKKVSPFLDFNINELNQSSNTLTANQHMFGKVYCVYECAAAFQRCNI